MKLCQIELDEYDKDENHSETEREMLTQMAVETSSDNESTDAAWERQSQFVKNKHVRNAPKDK